MSCVLENKRIVDEIAAKGLKHSAAVVLSQCMVFDNVCDSIVFRLRKTASTNSWYGKEQGRNDLVLAARWIKACDRLIRVADNLEKKGEDALSTKVRKLAASMDLSGEFQSVKGTVRDLTEAARKVMDAAKDKSSRNTREHKARVMEALQSSQLPRLLRVSEGALRNLIQQAAEAGDQGVRQQASDLYTLIRGWHDRATSRNVPVSAFQELYQILQSHKDVQNKVNLPGAGRGSKNLVNQVQQHLIATLRPYMSYLEQGAIDKAELAAAIDQIAKSVLGHGGAVAPASPAQGPGASMTTPGGAQEAPAATAAPAPEVPVGQEQAPELGEEKKPRIKSKWTEPSGVTLGQLMVESLDRQDGGRGIRDAVIRASKRNSVMRRILAGTIEAANMVLMDLMEKEKVNDRLMHAYLPQYGGEAIIQSFSDPVPKILWDDKEYRNRLKSLVTKNVGRLKRVLDMTATSKSNKEIRDGAKDIQIPRHGGESG